MSAVTLSSRQKAAILLMSLPPEVSAPLFKELGPQEVHDISLEIAKLPQISPQVRADVVNEFLRHTRSEPSPDLVQPTPGNYGEATYYADDSRAESGRPLGFLGELDADKLVDLLRQEHAQTIAVVLSYLSAKQAGRVLGELPPIQQGEVARRLAELGTVSADVVDSLQQILQARLAGHWSFEHRDGQGILMGILEHSEPEARERLASTRLKVKLCDFQDLALLDDPALHELLRLIDVRDLQVACQGSSPRLVGRVTRFLGLDAAEAVNQAVERRSYSQEHVDEARRQICHVLRGLISLGKISVLRN